MHASDINYDSIKIVSAQFVVVRHIEEYVAASFQPSGTVLVGCIFYS